MPLFPTSVASGPDPQPPAADDTDHLWARRPGGWFKCLWCGALTREPPGRPTPADWLPEHWEGVTDRDVEEARRRRPRRGRV